MPNKTPLLVGILFLCIILGAAKTAEAVATSGTIKTVAHSLANPCTISVVFDNGLNNINQTLSNNFTVSFNITNPSAGVGYYSIAIQWDPSALSLKTGTAADIVEGPWMKAFGSTLWAGPTGLNNTAGKIAAIPDGLLTYVPGATGNGTMFTIAFHAKAQSPMANITIVEPNVQSYLLNGDLNDTVPIDAVVDGSVNVIPEFSASMLLPLFLVATTIAITAATLSSRKRRILSNIS